MFNPNHKNIAEKNPKCVSFQLLQGLLLLAEESSSKLLAISLSDQSHYKAALLKLHFQLAEKPTHSYLLWELRISRLDGEFRNPQPELPKVQIRTFSIELCIWTVSKPALFRHICLHPELIQQQFSSPGWVRQEQLHILAAGASSHFQPWRDRAAASHYKHLTADFLFLMRSLQLFLRPSLPEELSCWLLANTLNPCGHFWVLGSSQDTVKWSMV